MSRTKIQSIVLDFTNAPILSGRQRFGLGPLKILDHDIYNGRPAVIDSLKQVRSINEANGYHTLNVRFTKERG